MRLSDARSQLRDKGLTLHHKDGEYRVNHKGAGEHTAYYTNHLPDAVATGHHMASHSADLLNAKANYLRESRLAGKQQRLQKIGQETASLENRSAMPRTQEALGVLGAGKAFGE